MSNQGLTKNNQDLTKNNQGDLISKIYSERFKARQRGYEAGYHYGMEIGKTLNPKIKQGEWILNNDENPECPFCHHSFTYWGNFCGNCGAYLKGGAENEKT